MEENNKRKEVVEKQTNFGIGESISVAEKKFKKTFLILFSCPARKRRGWGGPPRVGKRRNFEQ
jgi:hypothetical protein